MKKNIFGLTLIFILSSCATHSTKDEVDILNPDFSEIENSDFEKEEPVTYSAADDFYYVSSDQHQIAKETQDLEPRPEPLNAETLKGPIEALLKCYQGKDVEGKQLLSQNYEKYFKNPLYWNSLGTCYYLGKEYSKAIVFYNIALSLNSKFAPAINNLGVIYLKFNQVDKAKTAFEKSHSVSPYSTTPLNNLTKLYLRYGQVNELRELRKRSQLHPHLLSFLNGLISSSQNKHQAAINYFSKSLKDKDLVVPAILNLANSFIQLGQLGQARVYLAKISTANLEEYRDDFDVLLKKVRNEK